MSGRSARPCAGAAALAAAFGLLSAASPGLAAPVADASFISGVVIDFETDGSGAPVNLINGQGRPLHPQEYCALGVSFNVPCVPPISPGDFSNGIGWINDASPAFDAALAIGGSPDNAIPVPIFDSFSVRFDVPTPAAGFFVVSRQDAEAPAFTAFDAGGNELETVRFDDLGPGDVPLFVDGTTGNETTGLADYGFMGIVSDGAPIARIDVTIDAAILDDLRYGNFGEPIGACCLDDGLEGTACTDGLTAAECVQAGGTFAGVGSSCEEGPCDALLLGACCLSDTDLGDRAVITCQEQTRLGCEALGGVFSGEGTDCETTDCDARFGACCLGDDTCIDGVTAAQCVNDLAGVFQGLGTDCSTNPCEDDPAVGACCFAQDPNNGRDIVCLDGFTAAACANAGGFYSGDGSACSDAGVCDPFFGACCLGDGSCVDGLIESECDALNGTFQGLGTDCTSVSCDEPVTGACCVPSDCACVVTTQDECENTLGGLFQGAGTTCDDGTCPDTSCPDITGDGVVDGIDLSEALNQFGGPGSADINCDGVVDGLDVSTILNAFGDVCDTTEPEVGACCFDTGACTDGLTSEECAVAGGTYQGDGTDCESVSCEPIGACCVPSDCACVVTTQDECENTLGGLFQGAGTTCDDGTCPDTSCPDITGDGVVDGIDLSEALNQFGGPGSADINCDGVVDGLDVSTILNAFGDVCDAADPVTVPRLGGARRPGPSGTSATSLNVGNAETAGSALGAPASRKAVSR